MNPEEYDKKIAQDKKENPTRDYDTKHLEEFDIVDGKNRKEEEIEEAPLDSIVNHFDSILEHRDANEFVKWAKELVSKYIAIDDEIIKFNLLNKYPYM